MLEALWHNKEATVAMILFGIGFTNLMLNRNMIKKIIGFDIMDCAIYLFLAAKGYIEKHGKSKPDCLITHGKCDDKIKFEALDFTKQNLLDLGCKVRVFEIEDSGHYVSSRAVKEAYRFIKEKLK